MSWPTGSPDGARGEICLVVAGASPVGTDLGAGVTRVLALEISGTSLKDAAAEVAEGTGLSRRELYEGALAARRNTV